MSIIINPFVFATGGGGTGLAPDAIGAGTNLTFWWDTDTTSLLWKGASTTSGNATADGDDPVRIDSAASISRSFGESGTTATLELAEISTANAVKLALGTDYYNLFAKPAGTASFGSTIPTSNIWTTSNAICIWAGIIDDCHSDGGGYYANDILIGDDSGYIAMAAYKSGTDAIVQVGANIAENTNITVPLGTAVVLTMKHSGGQLRIRQNGGSWSSVASGTTGYLGGNVSVNYKAAVRMAQMCTYKSAITDANILEVEKYFGAKIGVTI